MKFRCDQCHAQYAIPDEKVGKKGVRVKCKKCAHIITVRPSDEKSAGKTDVAPAATAPSPESPSAGPAAAAEGAETQPQAERETTDVGAPAAPAPESAPPIGDEDLGNAFSNILGDSGLPDDGEAVGDGLGDEGDLDRQSTRLFSLEEMQKVQAEKEKATRREEESRQIGDLYRLAKGEEPAGAAAKDPLSKEPAAAGVPAAADERLEWYLAIDDQQLGPLSFADVSRRFQRGEIRAETMVWKSGLADWAPLLEVPELRFLAESGAGAPEASDESPAAGASQETEEEEAERDDRRQDAYAEDEAAAGREDYADTSSSGPAFAADVDWKPSAVSALSSLAEEELASLRPPEPEPLPEPSDVVPPLMEDKPVPDTAPMDDGDSSIIAQIRAEEEAAAREAERKREEEERRAAEARRKEDEAKAAEEAARRERAQEKPERPAPVPEAPVVPHAAVPRWLIGVLTGGGLLILLLLGFIAYILLRTQTPAEPGRGVPIGPPPQPAGLVATPDGSGARNPAPGTVPAPAAASGSPAAPAEPPAAPPAAETDPDRRPLADAEKPAPPPSAAAGGESSAAPVRRVAPPAGKEPKKDKTPKPPAAKDDTLARLQREERSDRAPKGRETPPAEEARPKKKVDKDDILNFRDDDEDDKALQKEMGVKRAETAVAPKPEEKKELPPRTNADVLEVMKQHLAEFQACSRKQKEVDASVQGRMVVKFVITPEGAVTKLATETAEFKGTFVAECIVRVISGIRFPKAGGGPMTVPFPFTVK